MHMGLELYIAKVAEDGRLFENKHLIIGLQVLLLVVQSTTDKFTKLLLYATSDMPKVLQKSAERITDNRIRMWYISFC